MLALCGAILGLGLAYGGVRLVQLTELEGFARSDEIVMDWRVLIFTLGTSLITGAIFQAALSVGFWNFQGDFIRPPVLPRRT